MILARTLFGLSIFLLPVTATANPLTCPPDVYSPAYDLYLEALDRSGNVVVEPQIYGSEDALAALEDEFARLDIRPEGVTYVFTDENLTRLSLFTCNESCSAREFEQLLRDLPCSAGRGLCLNFAAVVDGVPQCLAIPRPGLPGETR